MASRMEPKKSRQKDHRAMPMEPPVTGAPVKSSKVLQGRARVTCQGG